MVASQSSRTVCPFSYDKAPALASSCSRTWQDLPPSEPVSSPLWMLLRTQSIFRGDPCLLWDPATRSSQAPSFSSSLCPCSPPYILFLCFFSNFAQLVPAPSEVTWHALCSVLQYARQCHQICWLSALSLSPSVGLKPGEIWLHFLVSPFVPLEYSSLLEPLSIVPKPHYASKRSTATNMFLINRVLSRKVTKNSPKKGAACKSL